MNFLDALKKISRSSEEMTTESTPSTEGKKLTPKAFSPKFDPTPEDYTQILNGEAKSQEPTATLTEAVVEVEAPEMETTTEIEATKTETETMPERLTESPQYTNAMTLYYANRTENPLVSIHADVQDSRWISTLPKKSRKLQKSPTTNSSRRR
jgi:hypothetical protein